MANVIMQQPLRVFPAYNPARMILEPSAGEEDVKFYVSVNGAAASVHRREYFSLSEPLTDNFGEPITDNSGQPIPIGSTPRAVFDLGQVARNFFSDALIEINAAQNAAPLCAKAYIDRRLCVPFEITGDFIPDAGITEPQVFVAVNAALEPGVSEQTYSNTGIRHLTELQTLKYYLGYTDKSWIAVLHPISVSFIGAGDTTHSWASEALNGIAVTMIPSDGTMWNINVAGIGNSDNLPVEQQCIPDSPFYVRWVNRIGGREHWMFSKKQVEKTSVSDSVTYNPRIETNADLGKHPRQLSLTAEKSVVVGVEAVPRVEFDVLKRIIFSPMIEYYDTVCAKWRVITVKNADISDDLGNPFGSLEIEFDLPTPALQL